MSVQSNPCELKVEGQSNLVFTPNNWSFPQTVMLQAVRCNYATPVNSNPEIWMESFSADAKFDNLESPRVLISVTNTDKCPELLGLSDSISLVHETHAETTRFDPDFQLFVSAPCQQYLFWLDEDPARAEVYLTQCGESDCVQVGNTGCPYSDSNGFCYNQDGISYCQAHKEPRCHVRVPPIHGKCTSRGNNPFGIASTLRSNASVCRNTLGSTCTFVERMRQQRSVRPS